MDQESELVARINRLADKLEQSRSQVGQKLEDVDIAQMQQAWQRDLNELNELRVEVRKLIEEIKND